MASNVAQKCAEDGYAVVGEMVSLKDLGSHVPRKEGVQENITQIMWPSALHPPLRELPLHDRALAVARELIGDDAELDFDMMIHKAPHTGVPTPWHQDAAYWVDMPDQRAVSIWVALDDAGLDNGCMWYVNYRPAAMIRLEREQGADHGLKENVRQVRNSGAGED